MPSILSASSACTSKQNPAITGSAWEMKQNDANVVVMPMASIHALTQTRNMSADEQTNNVTAARDKIENKAFDNESVNDAARREDPLRLLAKACGLENRSDKQTSASPMAKTQAHQSTLKPKLLQSNPNDQDAPLSKLAAHEPNDDTKENDKPSSKQMMDVISTKLSSNASAQATPSSEHLPTNMDTAKQSKEATRNPTDYDFTTNNSTIQQQADNDEDDRSTSKQLESVPRTTMHSFTPTKIDRVKQFLINLFASEKDGVDHEEIWRKNCMEDIDPVLFKTLYKECAMIGKSKVPKEKEELKAIPAHGLKESGSCAEPPKKTTADSGTKEPVNNINCTKKAYEPVKKSVVQFVYEIDPQGAAAHDNDSEVCRSGSTQFMKQYLIDLKVRQEKLMGRSTGVLETGSKDERMETSVSIGAEEARDKSDCNGPLSEAASHVRKNKHEPNRNGNTSRQIDAPPPLPNKVRSSSKHIIARPRQWAKGRALNPKNPIAAFLINLFASGKQNPESFDYVKIYNTYEELQDYDAGTFKRFCYDCAFLALVKQKRKSAAKGKGVDGRASFSQHGNDESAGSDFDEAGNEVSFDTTCDEQVEDMEDKINRADTDFDEADKEVSFDASCDEQVEDMEDKTDSPEKEYTRSRNEADVVGEKRHADVKMDLAAHTSKKARATETSGEVIDLLGSDDESNQAQPKGSFDAIRTTVASRIKSTKVLPHQVMATRPKLLTQEPINADVKREEHRHEVTQQYHCNQVHPSMAYYHPPPYYGHPGHQYNHNRDYEHYYNQANHASPHHYAQGNCMYRMEDAHARQNPMQPSPRFAYASPSANKVHSQNGYWQNPMEPSPQFTSSSLPTNKMHTENEYGHCKARKNNHTTKDNSSHQPKTNDNPKHASQKAVAVKRNDFKEQELESDTIGMKRARRQVEEAEVEHRPTAKARKCSHDGEKEGTFKTKGLFSPISKINYEALDLSTSQTKTIKLPPAPSRLGLTIERNLITGLPAVSSVHPSSPFCQLISEPLRCHGNIIAIKSSATGHVIPKSPKHCVQILVQAQSSCEAERKVEVTFVQMNALIAKSEEFLNHAVEKLSARIFHVQLGDQPKVQLYRNAAANLPTIANITPQCPLYSQIPEDYRSNVCVVALKSRSSKIFHPKTELMCKMFFNKVIAQDEGKVKIVLAKLLDNEDISHEHRRHNFFLPGHIKEVACSLDFTERPRVSRNGETLINVHNQLPDVSLMSSIQDFHRRVILHAEANNVELTSSKRADILNDVAKILFYDHGYRHHIMPDIEDLDRMIESTYMTGTTEIASAQSWKKLLTKQERK